LESGARDVPATFRERDARVFRFLRGNAMMRENLLTTGDVLARLRISPMTLYRLECGGGFPVPIRVRRQKRWTEAEITGWEAKNRRR
jgi:predicted DNA-binding transcriptional regulator AlpA